MKRPSFQFYPADWRKHPGLRLCSIGARGMWIELMCIAHESDEYGKLKQNGRAFSHQTIAKLVGLPPQTSLKLLKELEENGVFSRDEDGAIYSPRMIKDEVIRNVRSEAGSKGGNPILRGNLVNQNGKQNPTPSSSSSSSSSSSINKEEEEVEFPVNLQTAQFKKAWAGYLDYRKDSQMKTLHVLSINAQLKKMSEWGHNAAISAINETIGNGWQGIFAPKLITPTQKPRAASWL